MHDGSPIHPTAARLQERLNARGLDVAARVLPDSTRTAADAAAAVGCERGQIVKSLVFFQGEEPVVVLCAGDRRVAADALGLRVASAAEARDATGFAIGGIPPLGHERPLRTLVDLTLRRYATVWCAAGTPHAVFEVATADLIRAIAPSAEVDVADPAGNSDWSAGRYERIAPDLLPAVRVVVDRAAPQPGERLVDIGCGTGSAAQTAAERGAEATGVDPSERLLALARADATSAGLEISYLRGIAEALPVETATVDVAISTFGLIFAADPAGAAGELARVLRPGGRFAFSAWIPGGVFSALAQLRPEADGANSGSQPNSASPPFAWHDAGELDALLGRHGLDVQLEERELAFRAASAAAFLDTEFEHHPLWAPTISRLEPGSGRELRRRALELLADANEDPGSFQVTSRYVVVSGRRTP